MRGTSSAPVPGPVWAVCSLALSGHLDNAQGDGTATSKGANQGSGVMRCGGLCWWVGHSYYCP